MQGNTFLKSIPALTRNRTQDTLIVIQQMCYHCTTKALLRHIYDKVYYKTLNAILALLVAQSLVAILFQNQVYWPANTINYISLIIVTLQCLFSKVNGTSSTIISQSHFIKLRPATLLYLRSILLLRPLIHTRKEFAFHAYK